MIMTILSTWYIVDGVATTDPQHAARIEAAAIADAPRREKARLECRSPRKRQAGKRKRTKA